MFYLIYQSIPSLAIPLDHPRGIFERANSLPSGTGKVVKTRPLGQKNSAKAPPLGQLFSKIHQKNTKHETEIKKNSTEKLICLEILKQ